MNVHRGQPPSGEVSLLIHSSHYCIISLFYFISTYSVSFIYITGHYGNLFYCCSCCVCVCVCGCVCVFFFMLLCFNFFKLNFLKNFFLPLFNSKVFINFIDIVLGVTVDVMLIPQDTVE